MPRPFGVGPGIHRFRSRPLSHHRLTVRTVTDSLAATSWTVSSCSVSMAMRRFVMPPCIALVYRRPENLDRKVKKVCAALRRAFPAGRGIRADLRATFGTDKSGMPSSQKAFRSPSPASTPRSEDGNPT